MSQGGHEGSFIYKLVLELFSDGHSCGDFFVSFVSHYIGAQQLDSNFNSFPCG